MSDNIRVKKILEIFIRLEISFEVDVKMASDVTLTILAHFSLFLMHVVVNAGKQRLILWN